MEGGGGVEGEADVVGEGGGVVVGCKVKMVKGWVVVGGWAELRVEWEEVVVASLAPHTFLPTTSSTSSWRLLPTSPWLRGSSTRLAESWPRPRALGLEGWTLASVLVLCSGPRFLAGVPGPRSLAWLAGRSLAWEEGRCLASGVTRLVVSGAWGPVPCTRSRSIGSWL